MEAAFESESTWLNSFVPKINGKLRNHLVAHRGFHCPHLSADRPLECTKPALKMAWDAGMLNCECDVRLSADGKIILLHDPNLDRLVDESQTKPTPNANKILAEDLASWPLCQQDVHLAYLEDALQTALEARTRLDPWRNHLKVKTLGAFWAWLPTWGTVFSSFWGSLMSRVWVPWFWPTPRWATVATKICCHSARCRPKRTVWYMKRIDLVVVPSLKERTKISYNC